ncbi:ABC transporter substrate-binding protein [Deinococcus cellulosilyticus]|uniref:Putative ABC transporter-binding protein n=1 Tax=Deinococcus cellulosilyticus (strain DSM 18568 / NBRC 106333 / KACC 11606 / 5516J-15) TaxID=1223518 RepID=A0A511N9Q6_DEIC1|nr:ABC transporter substrate-binding protein [Deinococcus cellulosilyticus]GEM49111.1 putative ABC transporter-binding protein [Deinococcus cellulosilyticus NBRC 106333 = KACC 11606]
MKKWMSILGVATLAMALGQASAKGITLTIACGAVGQELEMCKSGVAAWAKKTGNTVKVFESPNLTNDRLALYQQQLAAKSGTIDVYQIDVIWPGILYQHFVNLKGKIPAAEVNAHFPAIIGANTVGGQLVSMPWFTDAGLLYYRKDLLQKYGFKSAPRTWDELASMAVKIQAGERKSNKSFQGFVFQGKDYEGLTCNALEWIASFKGGSVVDSTGKVTINNANAVKALTQAASWVKKISPEGVTTYAEEDARGIFQSGNAAFMRNWPYAWALGQGSESKVKGKIGVAPLPRGGASGQNAATLGGWQLAVSKYSKNQAAAIELVRYLTGKTEQKRRAIKGAYNPTIKSLYQDKEVLKANPFFGSLYSVFTSAVARPSGVTGLKYNQVSQAFSGAVHDVLTGQKKAADALKTLESDLNRIKGRGW